MAYEMKNNTGSLFKNDRRQNDNQPTYQGSAMIDGKMKRISVWVRTSKNGTPYMSLAFEDANGAYQPQTATPAPPPQKPAPAPAPVNLDPQPEDLPF